ncbi:nuclease-related domain-containing protein [Tessaracoccus sp. MC1756]|uniref:nuclease-related domain-containing protein n=1 Tax=Tessaracoccus sp. MC1756 TaxID=2760311 RepID=UPI001C720D61|nr:nuclease-related domain-containing protein [Tessaracoccus sp. MC1756]
MVEDAARVDVKRMRLRYAGTCSSCGSALSAGTTADYDRSSKTVACVTCPPQVPLRPADPTAPGVVVDETIAAVAADAVRPGPDVEKVPSLGVVDGQGGASAAAEYQRRHAARAERVLGNHPRMGRFLLAVFDDPQSTRAWSVGAEGERMLGGMLASMAADSLRVLHDRRIPRTRANIDHLVVCPSGVFVVDAKRYRNARPALRVEGGLLRPRTESLTVGGRDRTALVTGMQKQVDLVRAALAERPEVPVRGVLCFVDADWPLLGGAFTVNEVAVMWPKKLKSLLTERGPLDEAQIADLQWQLHEAFPRQKQAPPGE